MAVKPNRKGACRLCSENFQKPNGSYYAAGESAPNHKLSNGNRCPGSGHGLNDDGPM